MRSFFVKIKKIQFADAEKSGYYIFLGTVYKRVKKTRELKPTPENVACTGTFISLYPGDILEVSAELWEHPKYGEQYNVLTYHRILPGTIEEIQKFLIARGAGLGIAKAKKLTEAYGLDTLSKIVADPNALDIVKLSESAKNKLHKDLVENQDFENLLIMLRNFGVNPIYAPLLYSEYGNLAVAKLKENPYFPFLSGLWPFSISDSIHAQLGKGIDTSERIYACVYGAIMWDSSSGGNLFIEESKLRSITHAFLAQAHASYDKNYEFSKESFDHVVDMLLEQGRVITDPTYNSLYLSNNLSNERKIAEQLKRLVQSPKRYFVRSADISSFLVGYESKTGIKLASQQKEAVNMALTSPVSIITGGPGTGKTHTIRTIIAALKELCPDAIIQICAPTGKASIRAEEMSGLPASTIHRMLKLFQRDKELKNEELECDFLIADEYSMVDAYLCGRLFQCAASFDRIIIVGDYNQLPSVGPGLVLRDFITCGRIPVTELKQVFRQAKQSRIIKNSSRIIHANGKETINLVVSKKQNGDFYFLETESVTDIRQKIQKSVCKLKKKYNLGINDIQILSPVRKTALGTESLNTLFQEIFSPSNIAPSIELGEKVFCLGDKVIHTKNNAELDVYNGEVGYITQLHYKTDKMLTVEYPDGKIIDYSLSMLDDLELAYALTVHKSQGSEFPVVIIPVHESILYGFNKQVFYTALTRAKRMVILVGTKDAISRALHNESAISDRRSHLVDRLTDLL